MELFALQEVSIRTHTNEAIIRLSFISKTPLCYNDGPKIFLDDLCCFEISIAYLK